MMKLFISPRKNFFLRYFFLGTFCATSIFLSGCALSDGLFGEEPENTSPDADAVIADVVDTSGDEDIVEREDTGQVEDIAQVEDTAEDKDSAGEDVESCTQLDASTIPTNLTALPLVSSVALTWAVNNEANVDHYVIFKSTDLTSFRQHDQVPAGTEAYTVKNLEGGTKYYFALWAVDAAGCTSAQTSPVNATPI